MSRAHMLYDDQPLQQEGVKISKWAGKMEPGRTAEVSLSRNTSYNNKEHASPSSIIE